MASSADVKKKLLPYSRPATDDREIRAVTQVLRSEWLTEGPLVERFERALADSCGAEYAVAVSSGTAALHLSAVACGIGPLVRAVTTPNTFLSTANCILHADGEPRFVDIDPATLNLDPRLLQAYLERGEGRSGVRAVIPVHFAGYPADMERIHAIARRRNLMVIEDACHALGARWRDSTGVWHRVGSCSHSDVTVVSFHAVRNITTAEGGAVLTNNAELAERVRELRHHGIVRDRTRLVRDEGPWYSEMQSLGFNYRISELHCAMGLVQLDRLEEWVERRRQLIKRYRRGLADVAEVRFIDETEAVEPAWQLCVVQVPRRAEVYRRLQESGIGVQVHYVPVHLHPYYRKLLGTTEGDFPLAEAYYRRALSLPLYPLLENDEVDRVLEAVRAALHDLT